MAITPPNSGIPEWVSQGNDPYKNPYLETFYNTFKQSPAFAMNLLQKLPGMNNLVLSAVNGGPLDRASINNPSITDFKGLENYYSNLGPNAGRPSGLIENLGYNFNQGYNNLEGGWTVAPGGMSNIGAINQWSQLLQKAAMSNDSATYHNLMSNAPQGVQLINFGSNNPYGTAPAGTTNGTTPTTTGNQTNPTNNGTNQYGAGYTGYGNINLASGNGATSTTATPSTVGGVTSAGTGAVDPNAGPSPAITQTPNTTTSAVPRARIANPAVGMPGAVGGLPNNANVNTNRTTMPVTPAPQVSGNYNMAIRQNHNMNNY